MDTETRKLLKKTFKRRKALLQTTKEISRKLWRRISAAVTPEVNEMLGQHFLLTILRASLEDMDYPGINQLTIPLESQLRHLADAHKKANTIIAAFDAGGRFRRPGQVAGHGASLRKRKTRRGHSEKKAAPPPQQSRQR